MLVALGEKGVKTLDDLADLAADELHRDARGVGQGRRRARGGDANAIIMAARAIGSRTSRRSRGRRAGGVGVDGSAQRRAQRRPVAAEAGDRRDRSAAASSPARCAAEAELLRFVVGPGRRRSCPISPARLPGRGLWLTARRDIVERAVAKRLFARAARAPVTVDEGLADRVEALLARALCRVLGLARRAGQAVAASRRCARWCAAARRRCW